MKMKIKISKNTLLLFFLLFAILVMGVGYAAINSITGEIRGTVIAEAQTGVFITNVEHVSNVGADLTTSEIKHYKGTMMQSTVKLSDTDPASEVTYKVTVYNNSENSYPFLAVLYDEEFYDNSNIIFEISADGYKIGDIINSHETKDIYITFKYKDGVILDNTVLNSYLNFKIAEPNRLMTASYSSSTSNYLRGTIAKDKIETIQFSLGNITPEGTVSNFDASEKQDKSIIGYYTDTDGNGLYELTFASDEPIFANINAQYLFQNLKSLKSISFDNFSTLGVTNMVNMFSDCSGLTSLDVSKFDTSKVTNMWSMFSDCRGLTSLDVSKFDTSQVTKMYRMFANCNGLTSLDLSNFNTSQVTNMQEMFSGCSELTSIDVSKFDTSKVTNMWSMFSYCKGLTSLDVSKFDTSQVTKMYRMFANCNGLTSIDLSNFNTSQVTNMEGMFSDCSGLTSLDVSKFDTSKVADMRNMFSNCSGLTSLDVSNFDTSQVTNMSSMFYYCSGLTSIDVSKFDTSKVADMRNMFFNCSGLTSLDVSKFDTSQVTNMSVMFYRCSGLTSLDVSKFDTSKVADMRNMFSNCSGLTSLDVSNFDTSQVTDMSYMFAYCSGLTELDLSKFDTSEVTNMSAMFYSCSGLTTIYVSEFNAETNTGWTTSAVTNSTNMFNSCTKIVGGNGTTYDRSHVDKEYARIDKTGEPGYFTNILNETTPPKIIVDKTSCDWRNSLLNLTITAEDSIANRASSGLATSNSYQYYLSNSETALSGGTWTNYTSGIEFEIKPETTGTYYLFIKRISDNAGNMSISDGTLTTISDETYQRFGAYKFDYTAPQISIISDKLIRSYDASVKPTWRDLAGVQDGVINGGTWENDYLHLDGVDDWVNLGQVDLENQVTLDATILVNEIQNSEKEIVCNYEGGGAGIDLFDGVPEFQVSINGIGYVKCSASKTITVGEKTRITGTYDGTNLSLYINGKLEAQNAQTGTIYKPQNNTVMAIGANPAGNQVPRNFTNINVYSAKVYDIALTDEEIANGANTTTGLLRSYDVSIKPTWKDLAGVQDGIINGGTWENDYLHLDGVDDWVNLGQVDLENQVTLDATILVNEIQNGERVVMANYQTGGTGIHLFDGVPEFLVYIKGIGYVKCSTNKTITVGEKTRITGKYDGTNLSLYINGKLEAQKAQTGTIGRPQLNTVMAIGANPCENIVVNNGSFANINVYSAKVYDVALTEEEIIKSYTENFENAIIRLSDPHSGLATGTQIQYGWSTSSTVQPPSWTSLNITGYSEGTSNVTTTIIPSEATEKHYLWVKSETSAYVQDVVGNKTTTTVVSEKKY